MSADSIPDSSQDFLLQLRHVLSRFPQGLALEPIHLAVLGWLRQWEETTSRQTISDRELVIQISKAVESLGLGQEAPGSKVIIERLMHFRLLRNAISQSSRHEYCLTRLGRNLARDLLEEVQYGTEDLCALINYAFAGLQDIVHRGDPDELASFLSYQLLGANREAIEYKLQGIEEGILSLEKRIKELVGGSDQDALDQAIQAIQANRAYVEELVTSIQEGSSFSPLQQLLISSREEHLHHPQLLKLLDKSLDFLHGMNESVDQLLVHVVDFIHQCLSYQSFVGSLSTRDRLCSLQQAFLKQALTQPVQMPVVQRPRLRSLSMNWTRDEQARAHYADQEALQALQEFIPDEVQSVEAPWKEDFLAEARRQWTRLDPEGLLLGDWLQELAEAVPEVGQAPLTGLWYLLQDWPSWEPAVAARLESGPWSKLPDKSLLAPVRIHKQAGRGGPLDGPGRHLADVSQERS